MSLELVLNEKGKEKRKELLSIYLSNHGIGELNCKEQNYFKHLFSKFYTPDEGQEKFNALEILSVCIQKHNKYNTLCFKMKVNNVWWDASIKRLCGKIRTKNEELNRAFRQAIQEQIDVFKINNALNPTNLCPIENKNLGYDAQVDHIIPFHILRDDWTKNNPKVSCKYNDAAFNYVLDEPFLSDWKRFHLDKAKLRWISKDANKYAHNLYNAEDCDVKL